jgi:hypothetical protein
VVERLQRYGSIAGFALLMIGWVVSGIVAAYGLFTHQGDDFYNHSPWGLIALPGYFLLFGAILGAAWGVGALGWQLILLLGGRGRQVGTNDLRLAWSSELRLPPANKAVLEVVAWTTGLAGVLVLFWGDPFLPDGFLHLLSVAVLTIGFGIFLLRGWTSWQKAPSSLGRIAAGVAAGVLIAMAYSEATRPEHSECVSGTGGRDPECLEYEIVPGPAMGNAAMCFLGAGLVVYVAAKLDASE